MPGLLRGVARTAVIAGTATHVSNNVSRRQARKYAAQDQAAADQASEEPGAPPISNEDAIAQIQELAKLKDQGILTQQEFDAKKTQLLGL